MESYSSAGRLAKSPTRDQARAFSSCLYLLAVPSEFTERVRRWKGNSDIPHLTLERETPMSHERCNKVQRKRFEAQQHRVGSSASCFVPRMDMVRRNSSVTSDKIGDSTEPTARQRSARVLRPEWIFIFSWAEMRASRKRFKAPWDLHEVSKRAPSRRLTGVVEMDGVDPDSTPRFSLASEPPCGSF